MGKYNKKNLTVVCPFYNGELGRQIVCEGIEEDSAITVTFKSKEGRVQYQRMYCSRICGYKRCALCKAISQKYDT